jgi:integrase
MARRLNLLSPKFVENTADPGRYSDGGGLYLQVAAAKSGGVTKSWLFRYMRGGTTSREMGLGASSMRKGDGYTTLSGARQKRTHAREMLEAGIDPLEAKRNGKLAQKLDAAKAMTFSQCAAEYIEGHQAGWKGHKHVKLWKASLAKYVEPRIGALPIASVDTGLVLKVLRPIWETKTKTAVDIRLRIELILNWAKVHGYRDGENPARWKGHLDNALPKPAKIAKVTHLAAMPYDELPAFMTRLREQSTRAAAALEWTILSVARTDETLGAPWAEIDVEKAMWTIPDVRMKVPADHRVPLTKRMLDILEQLPKGTNFVFSGENPKKKLPHEAMLKALKAIRPATTVHGFRSTFRDWAAEQTAYPNDVVEMALAHKVAGKTEAAYLRSDMFEKRRRLMADWATYCANEGKVSSNVVPMRNKP